MPLLETVDRDISLDIPDSRNDVSSLQSLVFPALKHVEGTFYMANLANITKINLPELTTCGAINLKSSATLSAVSISIPKLEECKNEMLFDNLSKLQEVKFPSLTQAGSFTVSNCGDLESMDVPKLKKVSKDLYICPFIDMDTDGFKSLKALTTVGGIFHIKYGYDTPMKNLILPPVLNSCHTLELDDCATLETVNLTGIDIHELLLERSSLINLTIKGNNVFSGSIVINGQEGSRIATPPYKYSMPKFDGIKEVKGMEILPCYTQYMPNIVVTGITKINGDFKLNDNGGSLITTFSVQDLTEVTGNIITYRTGLTCNYEFTSLRKVGGAIRLGSENYTALDCETISFPLLTEASDVILTVDDKAIKNLFMSSLTTITGKLQITTVGTNKGLTNLNGLSGLRRVGFVNIDRMTALASFEGLKNCVETLTDSQWKLSGNKYNPTLVDMKAGRWNESK